MNHKSRIICGDAYETLKKIPSNSVDLCYLDPPFFSNRSFEQMDKKGNLHSFDDKWQDITKYLEYMSETLTECRRVLKSTGSLYLHCDWHAVHYLKIELDKIFGFDNFRNEIIWRRHNSHNDTKQGCKMFGRVHDSILFYSKTKNYTWNPIYQPYPEEYIAKYYRHIEPETGKRYAKSDLSGPGGSAKGNPKYKFLGVTRYWRFKKENMEQLYREGKIIQSKKGNVPVMKRYLDEMPGLMLQDVWDDIRNVQFTKNEDLEYPTQKPVRLLERIIEISTNPANVVLDPFCGSGTSLVAARNLDRKFIGIEIKKSACDISKRRIQRSEMKIRKMKLSTNIPLNSAPLYKIV
ncbi:MAG: site-specific DNA-methyltransferase [Nitrososphaera sp.]